VGAPATLGAPYHRVAQDNQARRIESASAAADTLVGPQAIHVVPVSELPPYSGLGSSSAGMPSAPFAKGCRALWSTIKRNVGQRIHVHVGGSLSLKPRDVKLCGGASIHSAMN
jgi:hypothetical protein